MIRLERLTDYGLLLLLSMAQSADRLRTARDLAVESGLPRATVSRLLQDLLKGGVLVSVRGIRGGYALARAPGDISLESVITALEGPIALTRCSSEAGECDLEEHCAMKTNQRVINEVFRSVMAQITLLDLMRPLQLTTIKDAHGRSVAALAPASGSIQ